MRRSVDRSIEVGGRLFESGRLAASAYESIIRVVFAARLNFTWAGLLERCADACVGADAPACLVFGHAISVCVNADKGSTKATTLCLNNVIGTGVGFINKPTILKLRTEHTECAIATLQPTNDGNPDNFTVLTLWFQFETFNGKIHSEKGGNVTV